MNITIPKNVRYIIDTLYSNGYEGFMVGGCIRDKLLNKNPMDYDIATSAPPEVTQKLFNKTIPTGIKHGTITVLIDNIPYEVTTYRIDGNYSDNRKPDKVTFVSNIKEDLARRDFTINAFAYNHKEGLIDYFSSKEDLDAKVIRCVGIPNKRFNEDALRMLRAIRFSSQLNFKIEKETFHSITNNASLISSISKERVRSELSKILLSNNAYLGISNLKITGLLKYIFPFNLNIDPKIDKLPKDLSCRLSFLFLKISLEEILNSMKVLTFDNKTIDSTIKLLTYYPDLTSCSTKANCKRLINKVNKNNIFTLLNFYEILNDTNLSNLEKTINDIFNNNEALIIKDLNINGNDLKNELNISGKKLGETLNYLLNEVIEENIKNEYSFLIEKAKEYAKGLSHN